MAATRPPMTEISTDELYRLVRRGDQAAFAEFFDREAPRVIAIARRLSGRVLVDDIVRAAFVEVWRLAPVTTRRPTDWALSVLRAMPALERGAA